VKAAGQPAGSSGATASGRVGRRPQRRGRPLAAAQSGATPEALASGADLNDEDGHYVHGMVTEFEVG
jgi:hypothetical protein